MAVELWPVAGVEVRPTRVLVWAGPGRAVLRVVPLHGVPRPPRRAVRERAWSLGPVRGHRRGSPLLTLGAAGGRALVRAVRPVPAGA